MKNVYMNIKNKNYSTKSSFIGLLINNSVNVIEYICIQSKKLIISN